MAQSNQNRNGVAEAEEDAKNALDWESEVGHEGAIPMDPLRVSTFWPLTQNKAMKGATWSISDYRPRSDLHSANRYGFVQAQQLAQTSIR